MKLRTRGGDGHVRLPAGGNALIGPARGGKRTVPVLAAVILAIVLVVVPGIGTSILLYEVFSIDAFPPLIEDALYLLCMFGLSLGLLFLWVRLYERRGFGTLVGDTGRLGLRILRGIVVGVALVAGTVATLAIAGAVSFDDAAGGAVGLDAVAGVLAGAVLLWAFPAAAEEIIARGWLLQSLGVRRSIAFAVAVSSLVFASWHWLLDPSLGLLSVANLVLAGVFWALYALEEGSLFGVCAAHAAYNWAETNLFGFDFYGREPAGGSLVNLKETGPDVLTGGGVGLNTTGGLAFSLVQVVAIVLLLLLARRKA